MIRRLATTLLVVGGCFALGSDFARACGDKFLTFGPSPAMNKFHSSHPSKILVVRRGNGPAVSSSTLKDSLEMAGHKVKAIESPAQLAPMLAKDKYDAVLVDLGDAKVVAGHVKSSASQPLVVTVLSEPTAAELAAAQEYAHVSTPEKATTVMKTIDKFLSQRKAALRLGR